MSKCWFYSTNASQKLEHGIGSKLFELHRFFPCRCRLTRLVSSCPIRFLTLFPTSSVSMCRFGILLGLDMSGFLKDMHHLGSLPKIECCRHLYLRDYNVSKVCCSSSLSLMTCPFLYRDCRRILAIFNINCSHRCASEFPRSSDEVSHRRQCIQTQPSCCSAAEWRNSVGSACGWS